MQIRTELNEDGFFHIHPFCLCLNSPGPPTSAGTVQIGQFDLTTWMLSHTPADDGERNVS